MAQITIYLDKETERQMKKIIEKEGISTSKWIADLIHEKTRNHWPPSVVALSGAWPDFPEIRTLRNKQGKNVKRERL